MSPPPTQPPRQPPRWRAALQSLTTTLSAGAQTLLRFVWPGRCGGCDALLTPEQALLCPACASATYPCGLYPSPDPTLIDHAWACFEYTQPIQHALHAWKYSGRRAVGAALALHTAATLRAAALLPLTLLTPTTPPPYLIPVPLHASRLRARGFDQTYDLCAAIARAHPSALALPDHLRRARFVAPQVGLSAAARFANVADAFTCPKPLPPDADVWLIDDVSTTGATACACAVALRAAGAARVSLLTIARAQAEHP
jgi:ComF family protein